MKKINTKKKLLAGFVALGVVAGGVVTPLTIDAADDTPVLKIKKVLNLPKEGVKTPVENFTFTFTALSKNNDTSLAKDVPAVNPVTISYTDADNEDNDTKVDGKQVIKLSDDALAGVTWPESGQFTYTVTETKGSADAMTYSEASYTVSVFTKKDATGKIVVDTIQIKKDKDDKGVAVESPAKTEYNPGADGDGEKAKDNNFSFTNNYDKKGGNENPTGGGDNDPNPDVIPEADMSGFALMKTITGSGTINKDELFKFQLKAEKPVGTHSDQNTFKYKIVKDGVAGEAKEATYGTAFDIELRHHDRIVFSDILLGSTVSATETFDAGYTKSLGAKTVFNGTAVTSLDELTSGKVIGNIGNNGVYFVNTQQTPTGIVMNNLPYIVVVGVAGLGLFFFAKRRRDAEEA